MLGILFYFILFYFLFLNQVFKQFTNFNRHKLNLYKGMEMRHEGSDPQPLKGQLQRLDKLSLFDRFRHVENGFDINFWKFIFVFLL